MSAVGVVQIPFSVTLQLSALTSPLFPRTDDTLSLDIMSASLAAWGFSDGSMYRRYTSSNIRRINDSILGLAVLIQDRLFLAYNLTTAASFVTHAASVDLTVKENMTMGIRVPQLVEAVVNITITPGIVFFVLLFFIIACMHACS